MNIARFLWIEGRLSWPLGLWALAGIVWLMRQAGWLPSHWLIVVLAESGLPLVGFLFVQRCWLQERLWGTETLLPTVPFPQSVLWGVRLGLMAVGMSALGLALAGSEGYALWGASALCLSGVSWLVTVALGEGPGLGVGLGWWSWSVWVAFQGYGALEIHDRWWSWFALVIMPVFEGWEEALWARKHAQLVVGLAAYGIALLVIEWQYKGLSAWFLRTCRRLLFFKS